MPALKGAGRVLADHRLKRPTSTPVLRHCLPCGEPISGVRSAVSTALHTPIRVGSTKSRPGGRRLDGRPVKGSGSADPGTPAQGSGRGTKLRGARNGTRAFRSNAHMQGLVGGPFESRMEKGPINDTVLQSPTPIGYASKRPNGGQGALTSECAVRSYCE